MAKALLQVRNLYKRFGGIIAVNGCSFEVLQGQVVGLIGPNGAGKTTVFDIVSGRLAADGGRVVFRDQDVTHLPAHKIAALGMSRTFQECRLFWDLSCLENLLLAAQPKGLAVNLKSILSGGRLTSSADEERARELLALVRLEKFASSPAKALSFGQKRLLELACALMTNPTILLLDEPASGVNPTILEQIRELLSSLHAQGLTLLVVEHNIQFISSLADTIVVLHYGQVLEVGPPEQIRNSSRVIEAYLGGRYASSGE